MLAMWLSLRESMRCGNTVSDVIGRPERHRNKMMSFSATTTANIAMMMKKKKKKKLESSDDDGELVHLSSADNQTRQLSFRQNYIPTWLCELDNEDISKKVIEMIVQKAAKDPSKPISSKIKRVFRVHYPIHMMERFENYRDKVKKMAYERNIGHHHHHHHHQQCPRSTVDGNEVLRFYGTTMACCSRTSSSSSSGPFVFPDVCRDSRCGVCIILRTNFQTENTLKRGIQLSRCSEELSENHTININTRRTADKYNVIRRAVIVCRTIAGIVVNAIGEELINFESYSSLNHPPPHHYNTEYLLLPNPSAVLPCFVVVFS